MTVNHTHFINGKHRAGTSGAFHDVFNPSTGEVQGKTPLADSAEVDDAVKAAVDAFPNWSRTSVVRRARILFKFLELATADKDNLARLLSSEHGKVFEDARGDVQRGLEVIEFACGIPHFMKGEYSNAVSDGIDVYSMRKPLGAVACITPFNFPAMIPMWMFGMAIACGNTVVLKPSEKDPSVPLRLAELMLEAGAPPGVLNVLHGDKGAVDGLLDHAGIKAVSFVGSTPIAQYVYARGAAAGKRVQAMGGAKNHMIVMPDADIDLVVDSLIGSAYGSAGERCMANPVAVAVGDQVADAIIERLIPRIGELKIGPSLDPEMEMGPLVTAEHHAKVKSYIDMGVREGAKLLVDGREYRCGIQGYEKGFFMGASLFDQVTPTMQSYRDEIFGPVLQIMRSPNFEDAMSLPTQHPYGNGTSIFTRDGDAARDYADRVEVGMVGINVPIPVPVAFHTFGGWKQSSFGDTNQHGTAGVHFYTKIKTVTSRWPKGVRAGADFFIPTLND
ncbi:MULTISPECIES: CoA-acylating methylmalonate-semialdehyde dehydrogenase [unclassified Iodidimonas]|jgi:malonate-semialdehyde dehydrogenase (acetylating)/methylmalonate-semialdehyde dehydrogenase|uniref:CoA-acylating methylmalonate-semialdehyde dehydrogenase n=1 Tax=unclassified Iodidimonas TaxID=2626145 RepID=UPI002482ED4D|nr:MULTISPECIES: CoA-acylating methylmalonate-semialdehyde dehydrogenase [unclassified Iodidimonas]